MPPLPRAVGSLRAQLRRGGFWLAVGIPPLYLPVLVAGPDLPAAPTLLAALLALNAVGLVLGHGYDARRDPPDRRGPSTADRSATRSST